jgi:hypothetical protein
MAAWAAALLVALLPGPVVRADGTPVRITTMEEDAAACASASGVDDECLARVATDWSSAEPCERAGDRWGCLDRVETQYLTHCDSRTPEERETCYVLMGGELGSIGACDRLPPAARQECYGAAAALRRDPRIIETRIPAGPERDAAWGAYALANLDESVLDRIQGNEAHDATRVLLVMPLAIRGRRAVPDDYCRRLRGQYGGEYPEDADTTRGTCAVAVAMANQYARLESDDQRQAFLAAMVDQLVEKEPSDREGVGGARELAQVPDNALVFYTGQANELTVTVSNGLAVAITTLSVETRGDRLWVTAAGIVPADLRIPPWETRDATLTFRIADDAPDGAVQRVVIRGWGDAGAPGLTVAEFTVEIRRRTVEVKTRLDVADGE